MHAGLHFVYQPKKTHNKESRTGPIMSILMPRSGIPVICSRATLSYNSSYYRIHFLMAGQSFINNAKVDNDGGGKAETASLELQMSRDLLTFRNSAADIRYID